MQQPLPNDFCIALDQQSVGLCSGVPFVSNESSNSKRDSPGSKKSMGAAALPPVSCILPDLSRKTGKLLDVKVAPRSAQ